VAFVARVQARDRLRRRVHFATALVLGAATWWAIDNGSWLGVVATEVPGEGQLLASVEAVAPLDVGATPASRHSLSSDSDGVDFDDIASLQKAALDARKGGRLENSAGFLERALALQENRLGSEDPTVTDTLRQLGGVYADQRLDTQAEAAYRRALAINERAYGTRSVEAAASLADLALFHRRRGRVDEAIPLMESALDIELEAWGLQHPNVAARLAAVGALYRQQGLYEDAEPYLEDALAVREEVYQPNAPQTATAMTNLAHLYREQERFDEAEDLYQRALAIHESGGDQRSVALDLANLSVLYLAEGQFEEADPLFERALLTAPTNPEVLTAVNQLAHSARIEGRSDEAGEIYAWALEVSEDTLGADNSNTELLRTQYALHLRGVGHTTEADRLGQR
jgi:tetratricopeptide (TPR) repeat protein